MLIERNISAIGLDDPSADPVETTTFPMHKIWLSSGRMILENLTNLVPLPPLNLAPYIVAVWLLLGLILLAVLWFTNRDQVHRFGRTLAE